MAESSFNSNSPPWGFVLFALCVLVLELALFSRSYLLADRSTLSVTRTAELIENNQNSDMVILGASRSLAVDARLLEDSLEDFDEIYNYSVPSLGTSAQFAMILQKYLDNNRKPEVLLLALGPESFGKFRIDELFFSLWSGEAIRLRRFFSVIDLLRYMPWKEKIFLVPLFFDNVINSYSYRSHIRDFLDYHILGEDKWGVPNVIARNKTLLQHMEETNGQMLYWADREVAEHELYFENILPLGGLAQYEYDSFYLRKDENISLALATAQLHRIPVVIFFMPVPRPRHELMEKYGNFDYIRRRMGEFEDRFRNAIFLDMDIVYDMPLFGDSSHLNSRGADKFNKEFQVALGDLVREGYGNRSLSEEGLYFDIGSDLEGRVSLNGFESPEEDSVTGRNWRWANDLTGSFRFHWLRSQEERKIRISFEVDPYVINTGKEMILGTTLDSARVLLQPGVQRYEVDLLFPAGEDFHLSVRYADAASPRDLGASEDVRTLSVRWFNIKLQYAPNG